MKTLPIVALVAAFMLTLGVPAFASKCPGLMKEANALMANMDQNSDKVKRAKMLIGESDKLHKAGSHADSVKKAEEALSLIK